MGRATPHMTRLRTWYRIQYTLAHHHLANAHFRAARCHQDRIMRASRKGLADAVKAEQKK